MMLSKVLLSTTAVVGAGMIAVVAAGLGRCRRGQGRAATPTSRSPASLRSEAFGGEQDDLNLDASCRARPRLP